MLFEMWIFRNGQPDCDHDHMIFVAMTSTDKQCKLAWVVFCVSSWAISRKSQKLYNNFKLWNVNSILWWCWKIASDEREVDYWKSEVMVFVVNFCFYLPQVSLPMLRSRKEAIFFSISSMLNFKIKQSFNINKCL